MIKKFALLPSLLLLTVFWVACIEQTPIDIENEKNLARIDSLVIRPPVLEATAGKLQTTGDSPLLHLGQVDNKRASFLIRFENLPDSATVESAEIQLITFQTLGDTVGEIEATVHLPLVSWDESEVTFENFAGQFDPAPLTRFTLTPADTDTVHIALNKELVQSWIDSTRENFGLYVQTASGGFMKQLFSGNSTTSPPVLRLSYIPAGLDSAVTASFSSTADAFLFETITPLEAGPLYVSDGDDYRTLLKFDVSAIPEFATINRAVLTLTVDTTRSFLTENDGHVFDIFRLTAASTDPINAPLDSANAVNSSGGIAVTSTRQLNLDIGEAVQNWTFGSQENFGMLLVSRRPSRDLYRTAFYSTKMDSTKGPYLTVYFTVPSTNQSGESQ